MFPSEIGAVLAREVSRDLESAAQTYRRAYAGRETAAERLSAWLGRMWAHELASVPDPAAPAVTIRPSRDDDRPALARLAALDEAPPPQGSTLLAVRATQLSGEPPAAGRGTPMPAAPPARSGRTSSAAAGTW